MASPIPKSTPDASAISQQHWDVGDSNTVFKKGKLGSKEVVLTISSKNPDKLEQIKTEVNNLIRHGGEDAIKRIHSYNTSMKLSNPDDEIEIHVTFGKDSVSVSKDEGRPSSSSVSGAGAPVQDSPRRHLPPPSPRARGASAPQAGAGAPSAKVAKWEEKGKEIKKNIDFEGGELHLTLRGGDSEQRAKIQSYVDEHLKKPGGDLLERLESYAKSLGEARMGIELSVSQSGGWQKKGEEFQRSVYFKGDKVLISLKGGSPETRKQINAILNAPGEDLKKRLESHARSLATSGVELSVRVAAKGGIGEQERKEKSQSAPESLGKGPVQVDLAKAQWRAPAKEGKTTSIKKDGFVGGKNFEIAITVGEEKMLEHLKAQVETVLKNPNPDAVRRGIETLNEFLKPKKKGEPVVQITIIEIR